MNYVGQEKVGINCKVVCVSREDLGVVVKVLINDVIGRISIDSFTSGKFVLLNECLVAEIRDGLVVLNGIKLCDADKFTSFNVLELCSHFDVSDMGIVRKIGGLNIKAEAMMPEGLVALVWGDIRIGYTDISSWLSPMKDIDIIPTTYTSVVGCAEYKSALRCGRYILRYEDYLFIPKDGHSVVVYYIPKDEVLDTVGVSNEQWLQFRISPVDIIGLLDTGMKTYKYEISSNGDYVKLPYKREVKKTLEITRVGKNACLISTEDGTVGTCLYEDFKKTSDIFSLPISMYNLSPHDLTFVYTTTLGESIDMILNAILPCKVDNNTLIPVNLSTIGIVSSAVFSYGRPITHVLDCDRQMYREYHPIAGSKYFKW